MRTLLISFLLIFSIISIAQRRTLDSLLLADRNLQGDVKAYNQIKISKYSIDQDSSMLFAKSALRLSQSDTTKILAENQLAWVLKSKGQITEAKKLAKSSLKTAKNLNYEIGMSDLYLTLGSIFNNSSDYDSALFFQQKALLIFKELNDFDGQASILNNMSILYQKTGEYDRSKQVLDQSLEIRRKQGRQKEIGDVYLNLGNVYYYKGQLDSCIQAFVRALEVYEKEQLPNFQSYALANLAYIYSEELGEPEKAKLYFLKIIRIENQLRSQTTIANAYDGLGGIYKNEEKYDSAIYFYNFCLEVSIRSENKQMASMAYTNLGITHNDLSDYKQAKAFLSKSINIKNEINDKTGLLSVLEALAVTEKGLGNFDLADTYLDQAYTLAQEIGNKISQRNILSSQIELNKTQKNYAKTVKLFDEYIALKDSILNIEKVSAIEELKTQYETEKKEQQIALQNLQLSEQDAELARKQILLVAAIFALILIFALTLLQRNRLKKKQQLKLQEVELKAREVEISATISSQEKERARYARDLHDGFGQMISVLNMNLKNLEGSPRPDERDKVFENSKNVIDEMYGELKNICFDLMPQTLIKHGLESALNEFSGRINLAEKVFVELNVFGLQERLAELQEISLYRISQEWINNILKYSDATKITLQITKDEDEITLLIEDDGIGFDRALLVSGKGNGWKNLNTRAKLIKGELELETQKGVKGSTLIINAPVTTPSAKQELNSKNTIQTV